MDDRYYLALYDERRIPKLLEKLSAFSISFEKEILLPGYELTAVPGETALALVRSRFAEAPGKLYSLGADAKEALTVLDELMGEKLTRHMSMAADDDRLYNVYVYVKEDE